MRKKFNRAVYQSILFRQEHKCACGCGTFLLPGEPVQYDHHLALHMGGEDHPDNLRALIPEHHMVVTVRQAKARAKVRRIRAKRACAGNAKQRAVARRAAWDKMP